MSTVVTVKAGAAAILVTSLKVIDGGREMVQNGVDEIAADKSRDFIVDDEQVIRIAEKPVAPEAIESAAPADSAGAA